MNEKIKILKEFLIKKKKLELELSRVEAEIKNMVKELSPGDYGDVKIVQTSRLVLDTSKLKDEQPDVYFKYLKETTYKYATLNLNKKKGGAK